MNWQPIETMPYDRTVQVGNWCSTYLAVRLTIYGDEYIQTAEEDIPAHEVTATHWKEWSPPPAPKEGE